MSLILLAMIGLGWGLDGLFSKYTQQQKKDDLAPYRQLGLSLAKTLAQHNNSGEFINNWREVNALPLSIFPLVDFPMPPELRQAFHAGEPLVLESQDSFSMSFLMPKKQQVLMLMLPPLPNDDRDGTLRIILTTSFYLGILFIILLWLYPLLKHLRLLRLSAKAFGEGNLGQRVKISKNSYLVDIENEFNNMAQRIETLVTDNKLLGNAVSHDLRTPLARLRFGIEALEETKSDKMREKYQQHMSRDIDEMENLVSVLLSYARLEQAMIAIEPRPITLAALIDDAVLNLGTHTKKISWHDSNNKAKVNGDITYLAMLINNLLKNAGQYSHENIAISIEKNTEKLSLVIEDDGPGIAVDKREELLKPFIRGNGQEQPQGYGMGLAIVARIAAWHKATIEIGDSSKLGGAKMTISFKQGTQ